MDTTRERISLDHNWRFAPGHAADASRDFDFARDRSLVKSGERAGAAGVKFDDSAWKQIDLPHDWAIELPLVEKNEREFCEHGFHAIGPDYPENSIGWYRKSFDIAKRDLGRRISIEFDGVFRESIVWLNGHRLDRHASGHTPFRFDITDLINVGQNILAVRVDATGYEGWWYEGAGIYRHVWLVKTSPVHVAHHGTIVRSAVKRDRAVVTVCTTVVNESDDVADVRLASEIVDSSQKRAAKAQATRVRVAARSKREVVQRVSIARPRLWSPDEPNLYRLRSTIHHQQFTLDSQYTTFGIRTVKWDSRKGFFLNGRHLKIKGTCNHHQHAGVGTAVPDALFEWRLRKLKELGSNAYRCSHYPVAPAVLEICDRIGLMVMAENRLADVGPEFLADFESMIMRDRNHPSIILWSIGNEEHTIQWSAAGERIGRTLVRRAHQLDPTRKVTAAMHDRGLGEGFANVVDVHGWNYIHVGDIEAFHKRRPEQPIVGSEEGSTVTTRGEYADDAARGYVSAYDKRHPKWGSTAEKWWRFFAERDWLAGGFVWTGFDYKGEPIPYKWPCTSSHFGLMDLCGFPKDLYWYYRAWWGDQPVLHVFPHWNWPGREGESIDVRAFTNHEEVELLLNGRSMGRKAVERNSHVAWDVPYEPGELKAIAFRGGRRVARAIVGTTEDAIQLQLSSQRLRYRDQSSDLTIVTISAVDAAGRIVPTASDLVDFELSGPGAIIGVGNGDPSSHESDKAPPRSLFHGLGQAIVRRNDRGEITFDARSANLLPARLKVK